MQEKFWASEVPITEDELRGALKEAIASERDSWKKILILPPDLTRGHSKAGIITAMLYDELKDACQIDIMPALGTHMAMTDAELRAFFGKDIPLDRFMVHDWRRDTVVLGTIEGDFIREVSGGLLDYEVDVLINKAVLDESYDKIISVGQVVPHEVVGMANYTKNLMVGVGGVQMINLSHFLGAVCDMEKIMGRADTPVRRLYNEAFNRFLSHRPVEFILTVIAAKDGVNLLRGLYFGRDESAFLAASRQSEQLNLDLLDNPIKKCVVYLDPEEFRTTWVGNKAVYRTRMAIADGGELIILAPGVHRFGEDPDLDPLLRRYGYTGRDRLLKLADTQDDLKDNLSAVAHLIHGSSNGRFGITYCPGHLSREEIEGVGFGYMDLDEALKKYPPDKLKDGVNVLDDGEEVFYVSNPALGLWALKSQFGA
ncbi:MAG: lactate racemase domain-containing protein [Christensenellales bacterium]|jgi:nickel-dependent lactate racemase